MLATLVITGEYEIRGSEGRLKEGVAAHFAETHAEGGCACELQPLHLRFGGWGFRKVIIMETGVRAR